MSNVIPFIRWREPTEALPVGWLERRVQIGSWYLRVYLIVNFYGAVMFHSGRNMTKHLEIATAESLDHACELALEMAMQHISEIQ